MFANELLPLNLLCYLGTGLAAKVNYPVARHLHATVAVVWSALLALRFFACTAFFADSGRPKKH